MKFPAAEAWLNSPDGQRVTREALKDIAKEKLKRYQAEGARISVGEFLKLWTWGAWEADGGAR